MGAMRRLLVAEQPGRHRYGAMACAARRAARASCAPRAAPVCQSLEFEKRRRAIDRRRFLTSIERSDDASDCSMSLRRLPMLAYTDTSLATKAVPARLYRPYNSSGNAALRRRDSFLA